MDINRWKIANAPSATGSNWKEIFGGREGHRWEWDGGSTSFQVREIPGPGISLYRLFLYTDFGVAPILLKYKRQLKTPEELFSVASGWYRNIEDFKSGKVMGLDFTQQWHELREP